MLEVRNIIIFIYFSQGLAFKFYIKCDFITLEKYKYSDLGDHKFNNNKGL